MLEPLIGQSLDRYQIVELLGEGGMGGVFRARDVTLQRDVAIKVMHTHLSRQPNFQERFLQEARTAARLDHPGIVKVFDFGQAQSLLYIVMEYVRGRTLRQALDELKAAGQWVVLPEALQLVRQVSLAMDYVHRQGILHRDIKPDNIMLKPGPAEGLPYRPVLMDLGLAKLLEGGMMTQEGTSMGTPAYMSPEQAMGEKTDARSDVYSLGMLLYELAVGQLPFPIQTLTEAIRYHTKEPPPPPRSLRPDLSEVVEQAILTALQKAPEARFADAGALAEALAAALAASGAQPATATQAGAAGPTTLCTVAPAARAGATVLGEPSAATAGPPGVSEAARRVAAFIAVPEVRVEPGASTTVVVTVINQGPVVDHFQITVGGVPAGWVVAPPPVRLLPGIQQQVSLVIQPPRLPESRAGAYPLTVRVASQDVPGQAAEVQAHLTVGPYCQFQAELRPPTVRAGRAGVVRLENQGNAPQTFALTWQDAGEELAFRPPQTQVTVPEGGAAAVEFRAVPRRRRWLGGGKAHPFSARIAPPEGEPIALSGRALSQGLIPAWLPPVVAVPLLALCAFIAVSLTRPPAISSIVVDPRNPVAGQPVTVRWSVRNAQSVELRPLTGELDPAAGAYTFRNGFPASQSLTFVARNRFGSARQALAIAVAIPTPTQAPTGPPAPTVPPPTGEPTPSATPPTATPASTVPPPATRTPTPCAAPAPQFAAAYPAWQAQLGCPSAAAGETAMASQIFEHGRMFWRQDTREIYVLLRQASANTWARYPDTWEEGQLDHDAGIVPPSGLLQPVRGFGKVWRERLEGTGAAIGWAQEPEQGYGGRQQAYAGGLLLTAPDGKVFALFADGSWQRQ